ncbi:MAG: radical SAM family heme chaperone HemW [Thermodesulfobacteriota bacterium]
MEESKEKRGKRQIGVYIHIPFCSSKCPYCDFNSVALLPLPEKSYTDCLCKEFVRLAESEETDGGSHELASIYIGGGTPSLFSAGSIKRVVGEVKKRFSPQKEIEVTIEANPIRLDARRLAGFLAAGVNRINMGFQSLSDCELKVLGRGHGAAPAVDSYCSAREAGFSNIGVDLIFGLPGQGLKPWADTLKKVVALRPEHISLYNLTIEENTPFYGLYKDPSRRGLSRAALPSPLPEEGLELEMYMAAIEALKGQGYIHYEISNFALPERASVHNSGYWLGRDFLGVGSGAHSFLSYPGWGRRFWNERDPAAYMEKVMRGGLAISAVEELEERDAAAEAVMLGLRMLGRGIDARDFRSRFGEERWDALYRKSIYLKEKGLVLHSGEGILLAEKGLFISDEVMVELIP